MSSVGLKDGAEDIDYFTAIDFTASRAIGQARGAGARKYGRTRGPMDFVGSVSLWAEKYFELKAAKEAFGDRIVDYVVNVQELPGSLITVELIGCLETEGSVSWSQGEDLLMITTPLDIMEINVNGKPWYGDNALIAP